MAVTTQLNTGTTPLPVTNGGSGVASTVAYAPICGGTTTTSALQSVASLGTSGQVLQSQGSALPQYVTPTELGTSPIIYKKIPLSSANILAMGATPILLISAGGAHTSYCVTAAIFEMLFNTTPYSGGNGGVIQYGSAAFGAGLHAINNAATAFWTASASGICFVIWDTTVSLTTATVNTSLYMTTGSGSYINGDSTVNLHLYYQLLSTTI